MNRDRRAPAFQFYPKDWLADEAVQLMSLPARGAYITLLCHCWIERTLPGDVGALSRLVGINTPAFRRMWTRSLSRCFHAGDDGRLRNPRLEYEREKQDWYRELRSAAGKQGGRPAKTNGARPESTPKANEKQTANDVLSSRKAKKSSSSSVFSLQSSVSDLRSEKRSS